jgi:hypothetical protein
METSKDKVIEAGEQIGGTAGLGAGILTGMRFGSALIPIPVVGTFLGGLFGGVLGSEVGKRVIPAIINAGSAFVETMSTAPQADTKKAGEDAAEA